MTRKLWKVSVTIQSDIAYPGGPTICDCYVIAPSYGSAADTALGDATYYRGDISAIELISSEVFFAEVEQEINNAAD